MTALRYGDPVYHPTPVQQPVLLPAEIPPGVGWVTLPNGVRTLAYTHPQHPPAAGAEPVHRADPIPRWARTTALLAPTIGAGIAAAGFGISYAAPGVLAMAEALWAAVALIAAGTLAPLLLRTGRRTGRGAAPVQHITQNITATGLFGRATGTINQR
ncbi:hypothetical protein OG304_16575 [Streptomyces sp. NBC_00160]|uniref:hypothetical protein n=1 Tax=Streptomyces sp. NBC_00160 TaxID=2903628 RepID=UPI00224F856E|nr:hypothetical protein [Streptomyces sp. NBC_00160]MCX5305065.1 hypothetical protein [Streptomyces sp. NBC_00160]